MASELRKSVICIGADVAFDSADDMLEFAGDYLRARGLLDRSENRVAIRQWLTVYRGRAPITRPRLEAYLDSQLSI